MQAVWVAAISQLSTQMAVVSGREVKDAMLGVQKLSCGLTIQRQFVVDPHIMEFPNLPQVSSAVTTRHTGFKGFKEQFMN